MNNEQLRNSISSDITTKLVDILNEIEDQINFNIINHDQNSEEYRKFNLYRNKIATIVNNMIESSNGKLRT